MGCEQSTPKKDQCNLLYPPQNQPSKEQCILLFPPQNNPSKEQCNSLYPPQNNPSKEQCNLLYPPNVIKDGLMDTMSSLDPTVASKQNTQQPNFQFLLQSYGGNKCSTGNPIDNASDCELASKQLQKDLKLDKLAFSNTDNPAAPYGCSLYKQTSDDKYHVFFNKNKTNTAYSGNALVCKSNGMD